MEFVSKIVDSVVSVVVNTVIEQVKYTFRVKKNVNDLRSATKGLLAKRADVEKQIKLDEPKGREATNEICEWINNVESVKNEIIEIEKKYEQRYIIFGCCSPNCISNNVIGKDVAKKLMEVQGLCDKFSKFERYTIEQLPQPIHMLPTTSSTSSNLNLNLNLARNYLYNDDVGIIGIWGMGGVGKTHLLKQINDSVGGSFDYIIYVTASRECSVQKIQNGVANWLKLEVKENDSIQSIAGKIGNFLSKKNFLLLIDDLWERVDLVDVGIPFPLGSRQKVVFTTRDYGICGQMEAEKEIKMNCLNEEDAWRLFLDKVGQETIQADQTIIFHARELVKELHGLPLALITIGRAMRGKTDSKIWENDIRLLKESRLHEMDGNIFNILKFSYDNLRTDLLRQCFLICSLWPEDYKIRKEELIERWMGLGTIQDFDEEEIYNHGYALVHDLQAACLLEADKENDEIVTMHDVIRDMALWIARDCGKNKKKWVVKEGVGSDMIFVGKDIWSDAEHIALYGRVDLVNIPFIVTGTNLKTLILRSMNFGTSNQMWEAIRNNALTTLTSLDLANNGLQTIPKVICQLTNLRYLNMSGNWISQLPEDLKFLINLRYLILRNNRINRIPDGILSELKELVILDLYHHGWVNIMLKRPVRKNIIEDIVSLGKEKTFIKDIESLEKIKTISIIVREKYELQRLSDLVNVSIRRLCISNSNLVDSLHITPSFLRNNRRHNSLVELSLFQCNYSQLVFENDERNINWQFQNLKIIKLEVPYMKEVVFVAIAPKDLFPKLRFLSIIGGYIKNYSWIIYLPCLRELSIDEAYSVKQMFTTDEENNDNVEIEETGKTTSQTFPSLRFMSLYKCNISSICPPHITFPSLQRLSIFSCPNLQKLPFKRSTIPSTLKTIRGDRKWWNNLEWEDDDLKSSLQNLFM